MQFDSLADFLSMGGYGIYVWAVYAIGVFILIYNVISPGLLLRRFIDEQSRAARLREFELKNKEQEAG